MTGAILDMKLLVPEPRSGYVRRERLTSRLREGLTKRLILVSTPAGFGKTTILSDWIREQGLPAAWLSLDEGDNEPERFFLYLHTSMARAFVSEPPRSAASALPDSRSSVTSAETLLAWLAGTGSSRTANARLKPRAVIVLDDYHVIENQEIHREVAYLLKNLPEDIRLAIASRTEPPLPLPLFRARNEVLELHERDLRFSLRETESFFNGKNGLSLTREHIEILDERTEGWIAGLQLAALAIEGRDDVDRFVHDFAGSNRYVLDYLADEVFGRQSDDVQSFLLKTSILDRMTAELCDAVTGEAGSQVRLERIERENLFIVVLDDRRTWYRYHHLFLDLLRTRLAQRMPGEEPRLHKAAALWYEADGQDFEAVSHAFAARDYELAIAILDRATSALAMGGEIGKLLSWLDMLPAELTRSNPRISILYAWAHFLMADLGNVEHLVNNALTAIGFPDGSVSWDEIKDPERAAVMAQAAALKAYVAVNQGEPAAAVSIANEALAHIPQTDRFGRSAVLDALGDALRDLDDFRAAHAAYAEALSSSEARETWIPAQALRMDLARIAFKLGSLSDAEHICRAVLGLAEERHRPTFPLAQANILLGDILRERDMLDEAETMLALGTAQCDPAMFLRYLCAGRVCEARCALARGDHESMERALARARKSAEIANSDALVAWVDQFRMRLAIAAGRISPDEIDRWIDERSACVKLPVAYTREDELLTLARAMVHRVRRSPSGTDIDTTLALLDRLADRARDSGRSGSLVEILVIRSLALDAALRRKEAVACMGDALKISEKEGYVRVYADEGLPAMSLLQSVAQAGERVEAVAKVLKAFQGKGPIAGGSRVASAFSERELEVLRLIAVGMDNQEIADKLFISLSTVKSHITRLYNRLGVESRTQAMVRARELGLT